MSGPTGRGTISGRQFLRDIDLPKNVPNAKESYYYSNNPIHNHTGSNFYNCTKPNQKKFIHLGKEHTTSKTKPQRKYDSWSSAVCSIDDIIRKWDQEISSTTSHIVYSMNDMLQEKKYNFKNKILSTNS